MQTSIEGWKSAQSQELETWRVENAAFGRGFESLLAYCLRRIRRDPGDDWNKWWLDRFEGYSSLPDEMDNAVEFGCGPYTNIRYILAGRKIEHAYCSDPLIKHYLSYRGRWLAEAWRKREILIDDHPLEECPFKSGYFDLVVLINVLDHVKDSLGCIDEAIRVTKREGFLIIGQNLSDASDVLRTVEDKGHPIKISESTLGERLSGTFTEVFRRTLPRDEGRNPSAHCGTYLLIGRKE